MGKLLLALSMIIVIDCAQAGKNQDKEMLRRLSALQRTVNAQSETINTLNAQVAAQTQVIQQLATKDPGEIIVENYVEGQLVCTWEVP